MSGFEDLECIQIESIECQARERTEAYLRSKGWHHTSNTVGSYWMWFKVILRPKYERATLVGEEMHYYGCGTKDAFRIQSTLDREIYAHDHPEEFED